MFTKKHYKAIADVLLKQTHEADKIGGANTAVNYAALDTMYGVTKGLADLFTDDNPRFGRTVFYKAAGCDGNGWWMGVRESR